MIPEASRPEEQTDTPTVGQMMGDPQGRMLYIGNSSGPALLELVRMLVKSLTGVSHFTREGEHQQQMNERDFVVSANVNLRNLMPPKATALILIDSFFQNTTGTLEVFDEQSFIRTVHQSYRNIAVVESTWLCHFYLVLAIGLSLSTPLAGTEEATVVDALHAGHANRSEEYYFAAKKMCNPRDGFEDADFWSIQALALMSWFMLCRSQRSRAYIYAGMAIRSAHALGLHHQGVLMHFDATEQEERRKTWRTLFILDLFLADSLGRPTAMSEADLLSPILNPSTLPQSLLDGPPAKHICTAAFEASMITSHTISLILRKVYSSNKIEIPIIQEIAVKCRAWPQKRASFLSWRNASPRDVRKSTAILHCNLSYCQTIMLLSRPLFLQVLMQDVRQTSVGAEISLPVIDKFVSKYATICVEACAQTISIVNTAFVGGYLPRTNPIASYHVFSAALVIFLNELVRPDANVQARQWMEASILILEYCGEVDPQARQSAATLKDLGKVIGDFHKHQASPHHNAKEYSPRVEPDQNFRNLAPRMLAEPLPTLYSFPSASSTTAVNGDASQIPTYSESSYQGYANPYADELHDNYSYSKPAEPYPKFPLQVGSMSAGGPVSMAPGTEFEDAFGWSADDPFSNSFLNTTPCP